MAYRNSANLKNGVINVRQKNKFFFILVVKSVMSRIPAKATNVTTGDVILILQTNRFVNVNGDTPEDTAKYVSTKKMKFGI